MNLTKVLLLMLLVLAVPLRAMAAPHTAPFPPLNQLLEELPNVAAALKPVRTAADGTQTRVGNLKMGTAALVFSFGGQSMEKLDSVAVMVFTGADTTDADSEAAFTLCEMLVRKLFRKPYHADEVVTWIADSLIRQGQVVQVGGTPKEDRRTLYDGRLQVIASKHIVQGSMMTSVVLTLRGTKK